METVFYFTVSHRGSISYKGSAAIFQVFRRMRRGRLCPPGKICFRNAKPIGEYDTSPGRTESSAPTHALRVFLFESTKRTEGAQGPDAEDDLADDLVSGNAADDAAARVN